MKQIVEMRLKTELWISAIIYVISSRENENRQPLTDFCLDALALFGKSSEISESHPQILAMETQ